MLGTEVLVDLLSLVHKGGGEKDLPDPYFADMDQGHCGSMHVFFLFLRHS